MKVIKTIYTHCYTGIIFIFISVTIILLEGMKYSSLFSFINLIVPSIAIMFVGLFLCRKKIKFTPNYIEVYIYFVDIPTFKINILDIKKIKRVNKRLIVLMLRSGQVVPLKSEIFHSHEIENILNLYCI